MFYVAFNLFNSLLTMIIHTPPTCCIIAHYVNDMTDILIDLPAMKIKSKTDFPNLRKTVVQNITDSNMPGDMLDLPTVASTQISERLQSNATCLL